MIPVEFGDLSFQELSAEEVVVRFNALFGSNTRPKFIIDRLKSCKLEGNVYANNLILE